jgi:hypothetical protein
VEANGLEFLYIFAVFLHVFVMFFRHFSVEANGSVIFLPLQNFLAQSRLHKPRVSQHICKINHNKVVKAPLFYYFFAKWFDLGFELAVAKFQAGKLLRFAE